MPAARATVASPHVFFGVDADGITEFLESGAAFVAVGGVEAEEEGPVVAVEGCLGFAVEIEEHCREVDRGLAIAVKRAPEEGVDDRGSMKFFDLVKSLG